MTSFEALAPIKARLAAHYEDVAYADDIAEGSEDLIPEDYERHYCAEDGEDWPCATIRANAPTDITRLLAAIEAVEAIHQPITHHFLTPPAGSVRVCHSCREEYPCPTVAALSEALGGDGQ